MDDSGGSNHSSSSSEKHAEDHLLLGGAHNHKASSQCSVVCVYRADVAGSPRTVTVSWSKTIINHTLSVSIESLHGKTPLTCKVDLKPWPFWSKKGFKSLEVDHRRVDVFWDFRSAKFCSRPEPSGGYYVALVCDGEVALLVGESKKEAYKRTKSRPSLSDAALLCKRENVFGKRSFSTRARFGETRREHDIVVENSIASAAMVAGREPPEMWISIDGDVMIHIDNLQWKFRGNETVLVEKVPVQVFWDVHAWLFGAPLGLGQAVFVFKPGATTSPEGSSHDTNNNNNNVDECSPPAKKSCMTEPEFCFFLYAWKVE